MNFYPMSVAVFAVFNLYLLLCVVKGCLKFGMRVFFFFSVHPMRFKDTPLNSILFNIMMLLIASAPVVQFELNCFADYARQTAADVIFVGQIRYMTLFSYFFENNIFVWMLVGWACVALAFLLCRPREGSRTRLNRKKVDKQAKGAKTRKGATEVIKKVRVTSAAASATSSVSSAAASAAATAASVLK